jgi:hypothetical protein
MSSRFQDVVRAIWPSGIPASEYDRLFRLVSGAQVVVATSPPVASAPVSTGAPLSPLGKEKTEQLRALLSTGPATLRELSQSISCSDSTLYRALKVMGTVRAGTRKSGVRGAGQKLYGLPKKKEA